MLQGFYSAASGMLQQQRHLNVIANNLANVKTAGFKVNRLVSTTFEQELLMRLERNNSAPIGTGEPIRIVDEVADLWTTGGYTETFRVFDMGITGYGFFNVQAENGNTYLTRNGQFALDEEGYLELRGQGRVLGVGNQPIRVNVDDIIVDEFGNITNSENGLPIGQLLITAPVDGTDIEEQRNGMYTAAQVAVVEEPGVVQGAYENSNVDMSEELQAMIMAQRNFSSASQALQFIDATYAKAVNIAAL
ncbi:flagellar hook-basal body protein [Ruminococcaceae bacterium OttesenSCG-928-D13]|nr:flagellar hook-basal body protein [Ruminococcaceae bacterium OttesenSCG-928-D13]